MKTLKRINSLILILAFLLILAFPYNANAALTNLYRFNGNANDDVSSHNGTVAGSPTPSNVPGYFDLSSGNSAYSE